MNGPGMKRLGSTLVALLLLFYVGYQVYRSHYSPVRTETATYFTASSSVQADVLAIRRETLLKGKSGGVVDYVVSPGEKVAKGETVANIYRDEKQAVAQRQLKQVTSAVTQLQGLQSPGSAAPAAGTDSANSRICRNLEQLLGTVNSGDLTAASGQKNGLLDLINEKQIATGKIANFNARISALQAQKKTLAAEAGSAAGTIVSPASGYFIETTDGLESAFDFSKVLSMSCDQIRSARQTPVSPVSGAAGKICDDYIWYLACIVPADQVVNFRQTGSGGQVSVQFPFVSDVSVPAEIAAINQKDQNSEAAVILESKDMNQEIAGIRSETAQIVTQQYTGVRVSQKAVHFETLQKTVKDASGKETTTKKNVQGVYVMHGSQIGFRQIVPEFSTDNYVICDPSPDKNTLYTQDTVKLYDEVVVEGTDLYDGKVIQ